MILLLLGWMSFCIAGGSNIMDEPNDRSSHSTIVFIRYNHNSHFIDVRA